jgi:hypothetical protein
MLDETIPQPTQDKKLSQVSTKFGSQFRDRLKRACAIQEHHEGQLVRILCEWALPYYEQARSVEALNDLVLVPGEHRPRKQNRKKKSREKK